MKKKQSLICSALSIASILSMGVPALAAEPTDVPDVPVAETRLAEEATSMKVGDVIDLGDGLTAVVESASEVVRPSDARAYDTFRKDIDYTLGLYLENKWLATLRTDGSVDYSPYGRWVHFNGISVYVSSGKATVRGLSREGITGRDTTRTTAHYDVYAAVNRIVAVSVDSDGNVSFYEV